jgi:hypothetical protein
MRCEHYNNLLSRVILIKVSKGKPKTVRVGLFLDIGYIHFHADWRGIGGIY